MRRSKIRAELLRISKKHKGLLKPDIVVKEAENPRSVLHNCFEWNDTRAGRAYRLHQARMLINVTVTVLNCRSDPQTIFVSLSSDRRGAGGYRVLQDVLSDKDMRAIMLRDAFAEMRYFSEKYKVLRELKPVICAILKVQKKIKVLK